MEGEDEVRRTVAICMKYSSRVEISTVMHSTFCNLRTSLSMAIGICAARTRCNGSIASDSVPYEGVQRCNRGIRAMGSALAEDRRRRRFQSDCIDAAPLSLKPVQGIFSSRGCETFRKVVSLGTNASQVSPFTIRWVLDSGHGRESLKISLRPRWRS